MPTYAINTTNFSCPLGLTRNVTGSITMQWLAGQWMKNFPMDMPCPHTSETTLRTAILKPIKIIISHRSKTMTAMAFTRLTTGTTHGMISCKKSIAKTASEKTSYLCTGTEIFTGFSTTKEMSTLNLRVNPLAWKSVLRRLHFRPTTRSTT